MNGNDQEKQFLGKIRDLLNEETENLDSRTRQKLEQVRMRALRPAAEKRSGLFIPLRWIMVGSFGTVTMAAVALFLWLHASPPGVLPARSAEDFEIITAREHIDFYQNLDFYRWLATKENDQAREKAS